MSPLLYNRERLGLRPPIPMAAFVPHEACDEEDGIVNLEGGRQGIAFAIEPVPSEAEGEDVRMKELDVLERALINLPPEFAYQFIWWVTADAEDRLKPFEKLCKIAPDTPWGMTVESKLSATRRGREGFFPDEGYRMRRVRCYFTMAAPKGRKKEIVRGELLKASRDVEAGFESLGVAHRRLRAVDALAPAFWLLNFGLAEHIPFREGGGWLGSKCLADRLVQSEIELGRDYVETWGRRLCAMSLTGLPGALKPGVLNEILERYTGDLYMALNFRILSPIESRKELGFKTWYAGRRVKGIVPGMENAEAKIVHEELTEVRMDLEKRNKRLVKAGLHVFFTTGADRADEDKGRILKAFGQIGAEAAVEDDILLPVLLSSLPLAFDERREDFLRRARTLLSDRFACLAPVWGYLRSTPTPAQLYLNKLGEPVYLDPFDCDMGMHGMVIATTGAGKSFFVNELLSQVLRLQPTPYVFILDVGGSYERMCEVVGGQYVRITLSNPTRINPFHGDLIEEGEDRNIDTWMGLLKKLAEVNAADSEKEIEEESVLEAALREAFKRRKDGKEVVLCDIYDVLNERSETNPTWRSLANRLLVFTKHGRLGRYFDGANETNLTKKFVVFDLTEIQRMERLQAPMLMIVTNLILNVVQREDLRGVRKYIFIDEAWKFLKDPKVAAFIEEAYRTFRKYMAATWIITQDPVALAGLGCGPAILGNANSGFFLKQNRRLLSKVQEIMRFTPSDMEALEKVTTAKGRYSEFFYFSTVKGKEHKGVGRLLASPEVYWLSTSDGREKETYRRVRNELGSPWAAVHKLARDYPNGLPGSVDPFDAPEEEAEVA